MSFLTALYSDKGITKQTNQDSVLLKVAQTPGGSLCLAVVCDGMGGHAKGELASATVIRAFDAWFDNIMPKRIEDFAAIRYQWLQLIEEQNNKIRAYGRQTGIILGTTLTAALFFGGKYFFIHIGDSRLYRIKESIESATAMEILTHDQTVAERDIARGFLTPEQAASDPRRHVLLQCVGATPTLTPQLSEGLVAEQEVYMLCTDGLCHKLSTEEFCRALRPSALQNEREMQQQSIRLVNLCMARQETDNITVVLIKAV